MSLLKFFKVWTKVVKILLKKALGQFFFTFSQAGLIFRFEKVILNVRCILSDEVFREKYKI